MPKAEVFTSAFELVGEGGFEPPKSLTTDLQSAPFGHSGIPPYKVLIALVHPSRAQRSGSARKEESQRRERAFGTLAGSETIRSLRRRWSWWTDSNPRPADYKSAALPTELHQH